MSNAKRGRPPFGDILTPAEWRVVHAIRHGMSSREIADRLGVSSDAIKYHASNAIAKLGLENRKALRLWQGIPKSSPLGTKGEAVMENSLGKISQIARSVSDIKASQDWYQNILGLTHLYTFGTIAFFDCGGTRLMLSAGEGKAGPESIIYFNTADIVKKYTELSALGVEFLGAPHMIYKHENGIEEWLAAFNDLEGRPLAIASQVIPE